MSDILSNEVIGLILMVISLPLGFVAFFLFAHTMAVIIDGLTEWIEETLAQSE